ncbi:MAG: hypothetical protein R2862_00980 [Thermoanaerobaculia bacterium]
MSILYYAVPIVRGREDLMEYSSRTFCALLRQSSLYLAMATLASFSSCARCARRKSGSGLLSDLQLRKIVFYGLAIGLLFLARARSLDSAAPWADSSDWHDRWR